MKNLICCVFSSAMMLIPAAAALAQNDCSTNIFICDTSVVTTSGMGVQELNAGNQGCLTVEHNSVWFCISIAASGSLTMLIDPAAYNDFDFAVWGPVGANLCPVDTFPRRCSYALTGGNIGMNSILNAPETDSSEASGGNGWVQDLMVHAGEIYMILVDRSIAGGTFQISFGGTAVLSCTPPVTFADQYI